LSPGSSPSEALRPRMPKGCASSFRRKRPEEIGACLQTKYSNFCHAERSEASSMISQRASIVTHWMSNQPCRARLHFVQNDNRGLKTLLGTTPINLKTIVERQRDAECFSRKPLHSPLKPPF
jgi:hypothetical protein